MVKRENILIALKHWYIGAERINSSVLLVKDTGRAYKLIRKMDAFTVRFHMQVRRVRDVHIKSICLYVFVSYKESAKRRQSA